MATFTLETEPGPSAQTPLFMPIRSATGPLTMTMGAWGPVDMAKVRRPMAGSRMHSAMASTTGMASGLQPAITAFAAIFSTVPMPKPGSKMPTTSSAGRPDAATNAATFSGVGATSGIPSLQPASMKAAFIASHAPSRSSAS